MKNLFYLLTGLFTILLVSCNEEQINSVIPTEENQVMKFNSETEMQSKIIEIVDFKKNQEFQIMEKILNRNNLKEPTVEEANTASKVNKTILNDIDIKDALVFYHTQKLNAIYEERNHFNFISIQSIADEINSLKLLNPTKSEKLFNEYAQFLFKSDYQTITKFDLQYSNIIDLKGKYQLKTKTLYPNVIDTNTLFSRELQSINLVAEGYNNFVKILFSYKVGGTFVNPTTYIGTRTYLYTSVNSFVLSTSGYVAYPCYFFINQASKANFLTYYSPGAGNTCGHSVSFLSGYGTSTSHNDYHDSSIACDYIGAYGTISGTFMLPVAGTNDFLTVSGTKNF